MNQRLLGTADPSMPRMIVPAISFGILIVFCWLYLADSGLYERVLTVVSIHPYPLPFADWEMQPSSADCWQKGVNVYLNNTCSTYEPGGQHVYSPLWLRFTFLSADPFWVNVCGLGLAVAYIGSLALFPTQRRASDVACFLLTAISSATILVIERGNVDLLIYDMIVVALILYRISWLGRSITYVLFACGGLLKFYPVVLLALAVRERLPRFIFVALAGSLTFALFWWCYADEIRLALAHIGGSGLYFNNFVGARILPLGSIEVLSRALHTDLHASAPGALVAQWLPVVLTLMLLASVGTQTIFLMRQGSFVAAVGGGNELETRAMVAGAVLLCSCFFAGNSLLYRGIFLVLVVPRLLQLSRQQPDRGTRLLLRTTCVLIPVVCWVMLLQTLTNLFTSSGSPVRGLHWLLNELAWWWIIGTLSGVAGAFFVRAAALRDFSELAVHALKSARIARGRLRARPG